MKQFNHRIIIAAIVVGGLFVGAVKGTEARARWITKMKGREDRKVKADKTANEVELDDYEIASFHNN